MRQVTRDEAAAVPLRGWNIRCNRCGSYGATWHPGLRPGWGSLALCEPHSNELHAEMDRHEREMHGLTQVNYEQERQ